VRRPPADSALPSVDEHRQRQGEAEHRPVDADLASPRAVARGEGDQHLHAAEGEHEPKDSAAKRQHEILDQQQAAEASGARAQRGAHDQLLLAANAAHQRQVGHVCAGDDEDERRCAHQ